MPVRRLGRGVSRAILPMHRDPRCGYTRWSIIQTQQGIVLAMIGLTKTSLFRINLIFLRTKEEKKWLSQYLLPYPGELHLPSNLGCDEWFLCLDHLYGCWHDQCHVHDQCYQHDQSLFFHL
jgi:hypothetical protein